MKCLVDPIPSLSVDSSVLLSYVFAQNKLFGRFCEVSVQLKKIYVLFSLWYLHLKTSAIGTKEKKVLCFLLLCVN